MFGMGTGVAVRVCSPGILGKYQLVAAVVAKTFKRVLVVGGMVNAAKRSAVSTGQLRRLPALHTRPIDPVVFREPSARRQGGLVLRGVSRLDAFSVYPGRT